MSSNNLQLSYLLTQHPWLALIHIPHPCYTPRSDDRINIDIVPAGLLTASALSL